MARCRAQGDNGGLPKIPLRSIHQGGPTLSDSRNWQDTCEIEGKKYVVEN